MADRKVRIVVTCSNRKSLVGPAHLQVRTLPKGTVARAISTWLDRLETVPSPALPARDLYGGEHWQVALSLEATGRGAGVEVEMWIVSAGYGLTAPDEEIKPYSATFAPGHPDSVGRFSSPDGSAKRAWWEQLQRRRRSGPSNLADLASQAPSAPLLVAVGASYLSAVFEDLLLARQRLCSPELLHVVSAGTGHAPDLGKSLVPASARLQAPLGGTRISLNARILKTILASSRRHAFAPDGIRLTLEQLATQAHEERPIRRRQSDYKVGSFIRDELKRTPGTSKDQLLRRLRDSGLACEQRRFGDIYEAVAKSR